MVLKVYFKKLNFAIICGKIKSKFNTWNMVMHNDTLD